MRAILKLICLFGLSSCITPIDQDLDDPAPLVVIEGFIDDDFGPHEIQISTLTKFASAANGGGITRLDASVRVFDDLGNSFLTRREDLIREGLRNAAPPTLGNGSRCVPELTTTEVTTNYHTSSSFRGIPGRSYGLEVVLDNGTVFRSDLQLLPESPDIDSVIIDFASKPDENDLIPRTGLDVFVLWQDDPEVENFHFWEIDGTYSIQTPDLGVSFSQEVQICCLYDPRRGNGSTLGESCWVVERNLPGTKRAFDDRLTNGTQTVEFIGFVEDDGRRFSSGLVPGDKQYFLEVHQYSINEQAFNFYNNIDVLSEIDGEIFDPPPIGARGNMVSISDPNAEVAGFFGVFGKKTKGIFVNRSLFPSINQHGICGDCRFFARGQFEVPEPYR